MASGRTLRKPSVICTDACVVSAFEWYLGTHPDGIERAYIFFDQNEPFMHDFRQRWLTNEKPKRKIAPSLFWGMIANVQPINSEDNPPLQAADMLAWARTRVMSKQPRPLCRLAELMWQVVPQSGTILDEEALRSKDPMVGATQNPFKP